ncbi:dethiobiotin synthase [Polaromonas sp. P1-6]|nr:dethiobiotin synthase [Polaromonas sp. P1-6]
MNSDTPLRGCFITDTDTEVGKTRVSAALLYWCAQQGWRSAGFKPVAAGTSVIDGQRVDEDVRALRDASSLALTDAEVGPLQFEAACAPHIAATLEGQAIDRAAILRSAHVLAARADALVVEGVGGLRPPQSAVGHLALGLCAGSAGDSCGGPAPRVPQPCAARGRIRARTRPAPGRLDR